MCLCHQSKESMSLCHSAPRCVILTDIASTGASSFSPNDVSEDSIDSSLSLDGRRSRRRGSASVGSGISVHTVSPSFRTKRNGKLTLVFDFGF